MFFRDARVLTENGALDIMFFNNLLRFQSRYKTIITELPKADADFLQDRPVVVGDEGRVNL